MRTREVEWAPGSEWFPWEYDDAFHLVAPSGGAARKLTRTGWRSAAPEAVLKEGKAIREPEWEPWIKGGRWFLIDAEGYNCLECKPSGWSVVMEAPVRQEGRRMVRAHWLPWRLGQRHFLMAPTGSPCFELTPYGWMDKDGGSVTRVAEPIGFGVDRPAVTDLSPLDEYRDQLLREYTTLSFPADVRYLEMDGRPVAVYRGFKGRPTATALDDLGPECGPVGRVLNRGREVDGLTFLKMVAQVDERQCPFRHLLSH